MRVMLSALAFPVLYGNGSRPAALKTSRVKRLGVLLVSWLVNRAAFDL